jgi:arylsulfatase A-like enzyme
MLIFGFANHGKQTLSHGLVEKFDNADKEFIHIPLIISNPKLHVCSQETHSLISVLDIVPTVANLLGVFGALESYFYGTSQFGGSIG